MNNGNYKIEGNTIYFQNGKSLNFDYSIKESRLLIIDRIMIITLEIPQGIEYPNNVFAANFNGDLLWRINVSIEDLFYKSSKNFIFIGSAINRNGDLVLFNWNDTAFVVNYLTGEVISKYNSK